ncbi:hypothetical protein ABZS44_18585 [Micromonospora sediminicola]|uniref:hypothetical protein n=1 Tax=Micromonospora sediminicola TaxID=946078 RepID=UPI00339E4BB7
MQTRSRMDGGLARAALPTGLGVSLTATTPARPGLRVEAAGGGRLLIRQAERIVLLARQGARHHGVRYARTGDYRSPLPPITAAAARRVRETSPDAAARAMRWTHRFADWLGAAEQDGPLHRGRWTLAAGMPDWSVATHWDRLTRVDPDRGHVTWFGYGDPDDDLRDVLPLRRLAPAGHGRVRAWRRQARAGVLPPVLLWWVSGLQTLVLLDGHDRAVAALTEGGPPDVVVLAPADQGADRMRHEIDGYVRRMRHLETADVPAARLAVESRGLAEGVAEAVRAEGRTTAWPVRGGSREWERLAVRLAPGWDTGSRP